MTSRLLAIILLFCALSLTATAAERDRRQNNRNQDRERAKGASLYDIAPRQLVDIPTAGTLPRGYFDMGLRIYGFGGALGYTNVGLTNRLTIGISYGGEKVLSNTEPDWN